MGSVTFGQYIVNGIVDYFVPTRIGQFCVKKVDALFWTVENVAKYSVQQEGRTEIKLFGRVDVKRRLPWLVFWVVLIDMHIIRALLSNVLVKFNKNPIESKDIVKEFRKWRKQLRSIRLKGIRKTRTQNRRKAIENGDSTHESDTSTIYASKKRHHFETEEEDLLAELINETFSDTDNLDSTYLPEKSEASNSTMSNDENISNLNKSDSLMMNDSHAIKSNEAMMNDSDAIKSNEANSNGHESVNNGKAAVTQSSDPTTSKDPTDALIGQFTQKSDPANDITSQLENFKQGNKNAGNFSEYPKITNLLPCIASCCQHKDTCNVAFIFNETCYQVQCASNDLCIPSRKPNITMKLQMVLVNPVTEGDTWVDVLKSHDFDDIPIENRLNPSYFDNANLADALYGNYFEGYPSSGQYVDENDLQMDESKIYSETSPCQMGLHTCPPNEKCVPLIPTSRQGLCNCISGYERDANGLCVSLKLAESLIMKDLNSDGDLGKMSVTKSDSSEKPFNNKLVVSVVSKVIRLPEKQATLIAYTIPDEKASGDTYKYLWSLISQPSDAVNGTTSDKAKDKIVLSNLSEGLYRFKVVVTGSMLKGEAYANVTVLPEKRTNTPPQVIITPQQQTLKLPTSKAILDGSTSKNDDQIINWHWDIISGPIGYEPNLTETSTLQLSDLTSPGNYTFRLTVTDSDKEKNSTTATITVLKASDYPPEANAGADVILYLPHNSVTLNGSQRTDDREIVTWEWTKDSSDVSKAVDVQNTRPPYLELSNLEEGIYTFELKVTDASNQSSTAKVHVFVKAPTNLPPVKISAGQNFSINLPQTWATLNGSQSTKDVKIVEYKWKQLEGPTSSTILNGNASVANATGLTIGSYLFELSVVDENKNNANDTVLVAVVQEKNAAPVANAGGDQSITLPANSIYLNGSKSSDDLGIVRYTWTRDGSSLAIGNIVGNTSSEAVLIITNVVPGRYVFTLTVADAQGLPSSDTVSIIIHPDPMVKDLVELTLTMGVSVLTQQEIDSLEQKLILLLGDNTRLHVRDLKMEQKTGEAVLVFYVEKTSATNGKNIMPGLEIEKLLTERFWKDRSILGTSISDVRTVLCQNKCSGHGVCNSETRECTCETFWMPDIFYFWGIGQANCDWSILYVVIGVFLGFLSIFGCCWGLTCMCRRTRKPRTRTKTQKYALLGTQDDEIPSLTRGTSLSDSETDSDVESRSKSNGILRSNGSVKNAQSKYSVTRLGHRIKT